MRSAQLVRIGVLVLSFVTWLPAPVAAQSWRELQGRGDYVKAAELLHSVVLNGLIPNAAPEIDATEALARLYWDGNGVIQDRVVACSFVRLAAGRAGWVDPQNELSSRIDRIDSVMCGGLSHADRLEAEQMIGCPRYGFDPYLFTLPDRRTIEVTRRGIRVGRNESKQPEPLPVRCFERIALVRYADVDAPGGSEEDVTSRHFLELYSWAPVGAPAGQLRSLQWTLWEILGSKLESREHKELGTEARATWVPGDVPAEKSDLSMQMAPGGEVTWRFGRTELTGILDPLPEQPPVDRDDLPALPTTGNARIDVTVTDRFGAALEGATVKITGVVQRELTADVDGLVSFTRLPRGRYDVVASSKRLAPSVPRVVDLSESSAAAVAFTLKPFAPTTTLSMACGGLNARSVRALAGAANMVLHVRITGQKTTGPSPADDDMREGLATFSAATVVQSFKKGRAGNVKSTLTIRQEGGRIDRGDYIDAHSVNQLAPLNIGDEYVIFVVFSADGTASVHGHDEGVFRIRNGRVEPLGDGGAAAAWKGRSAAAFFSTLQSVSKPK